MEEPRSWVEEARASITREDWRHRLAQLIVRDRDRRGFAFRPREVVALAVLVLAIVCGAGVAFMRALPRTGTDVQPSTAAEVIAPSVSPSPTPGVVVYVTGAVHKPGVYDFALGARVIDALKVAGGLTPLADVSVLNLAQPLTDGERLYVPRKGETPPPELSAGGSSGGGASGGKVNINTATVAELDAGIPGVGPVLAQRIVDYRTQHGPFRAVEDLRKVQGIGDKKLASIKDHVRV